jgi:hypothetical protein
MPQPVTKISLCFDDESVCSDEVEYETIRESVLDLSASLKRRKIALQDYYDEVGDNAIEVISIISGMYQFSGTSILEEYLTEICFRSEISSFLKIEAATSLITFEELEDDSDHEDFDFETNKKIQDRNTKRKKSGYEALHYVTLDMEGVPTPCKITAACYLMKSAVHKWASDLNFKSIISDQELDCEFRYKTILSLENKDIDEKEYFIRNALITFLADKQNMVYFRILAAQCLLTRHTIDKKVTSVVEQTTLGFATDEELDYDRRADAADLLLRVGSTASKVIARNVIIALGGLERTVKTVFDNAQNVHTEGVEESVAEILESLFNAQEGLEKQSFDSVVGAIKSILKENAKISCECSHESCDKCKTCKNTSGCEEFNSRREAIHLALTRIEIDRGIYSVYSLNLTHVLVLMWTYMKGHNHEIEMITRLMEELVEMSATCSTGYISRLTNVLSGFGEFSVRISWEDQIVANFTGRLNAAARNIVETKEYYTSPVDKKIAELWLRKNLNVMEKVKEEVANLNMEEIVAKFLEKDVEKKLRICVEDFSSNVLDELTVDSSKQYGSRPNFLLFFSINMSKIREELAEEFSELITSDSFEMHFRKAIMVYEGTN